MLAESVTSLDNALTNMIKTNSTNVNDRITNLEANSLQAKGLIGPGGRFKTIKDWAEWITKNTSSTFNDM